MQVKVSLGELQRVKEVNQRNLKNVESGGSIGYIQIGKLVVIGNGHDPELVKKVADATRNYLPTNEGEITVTRSLNPLNPGKVTITGFANITKPSFELRDAIGQISKKEPSYKKGPPPERLPLGNGRDEELDEEIERILSGPLSGRYADAISSKPQKNANKADQLQPDEVETWKDNAGLDSQDTGQFSQDLVDQQPEQGNLTENQFEEENLAENLRQENEFENEREFREGV